MGFGFLLGLRQLLQLLLEGVAGFFVLAAFILFGMGRSILLWLRRPEVIEEEEEAEATRIDV